MEKVTISPKYQVVIPKKLREKLKLKPGNQLIFIDLGDGLTILPVRDPKDYYGSLPGIDTEIDRSGDRY